MANDVARIPFSASTQGQGIKIAATTTPGTLVHTTGTSATIQDAFESWAVNPMGPSPLVVKPWFDAQIHWNERVKWLNTDKMRQLLADNPVLEPVVIQHLSELQMVLAPPIDPATGQPMAPQTPVPQGAGMAMANSNQESGGTAAGPPLQVGV